MIPVEKGTGMIARLVEYDTQARCFLLGDGVGTLTSRNITYVDELRGTTRARQAGPSLGPI